MSRTFRTTLATLAVACFAAPAPAQEPIRLARTPDISPDGKLVAFSYLGDVWTVESIGGTARQVTSHVAHDVNPVFSPDGRHLAFSSNRHGSYDVFVVPVQGGRPRRLTFDSANDYAAGWSPDGKTVLFTSTRSTDFPPSYELFTVPVAGGMARRVTTAGAKEGVFSPGGDRIAYVRGPGTWYRKGYRGSANDDLWVCNADGSNNRRVTAFDGQDSSPMWGPDGKTLYYVSEFHGSANIVAQPLAAAGAAVSLDKPRQLTFHKDDSVRRARISRDGNWIVYECGPDLWVVGTREGSQARKLAVAVYADDKTNPERVQTFTNRITEFSLSHDEKYVAFAVHGKLFRRLFAGKDSKPVQMTDGASNDHGVAWAPDGSKIIFVSDRKGRDDLYLLEADDPEHPKFTDAHRFKVKQLTDTPEAEFGVQFAPNGRRVGFLRAGKLWTMAPDGKDQKPVVDDVHVFDYEWSPDSRWIAYARRDGSFASEVFIVPAGGPTAADPPRNVTRYATFNGGITWSRDGKKLAFLSERSERRGATLPYVLNLQKPAAPGYTEKTSLLGGTTVSIDWEDVHLRARAVAPMPADEAAVSPDGSKVAFRSASGGSDLWVASTTGHQVMRLTTGNQRPRQITWSKRKSPFGGGTMELIYFLDGAGNLRAARPSGSGDAAAMPFKVKMTVKNEELYEEMFDQTWRYLAENFYDAKFHGRDWAGVRSKYRPLVKHVAVKEDLYALLYLMLGELNASHLGVSGFTGMPDETTADLGLIFDEGYRGKGLKVKEVLKRGPADRRGLAIKPGDVVTAIDGVEVTPKVDVSKLLNGKEGESVVVQVTNNPAADPKAPGAYRRYEIQATNRGQIHDLMYDRWVEHNAARVRELSKGKLGYIHIPNMQEDGLDRFVRSLYSDNFDKEAIVLDVRYNGGGFTHDQVLNYLAGREHTLFRQRDGGQGLVLRSSDRKWTRPLVLLINNQSYSDAEIFPNAFRTMGLGKLVGQPTGGFVIGTGSVRLIDGSLLRVPRIGVYTARGVNMEKEGVRPDVLVEPHPDQVARGQDLQLDKAVEVLQADVIAWKKKNQATVAANPEATGKPGTPGPVVTPLVTPK